MKLRSETERMIYAAVFAAGMTRPTRSVDNSTAENAIVEAEWAVECHRQAIRERSRPRGSR